MNTLNDNSGWPSAAAATLDCDLSRKFVRVLRESADGLVAFEFAIGWPDLSVELAMPKVMFEEFCIRQQVQLLTDHDPSPMLEQTHDHNGDDE
ncbi:MAG: phenol hydroxylase [Betaproteobacteria bacterium]|nr:phenol hydroxylase [Betaproteobacteria bacterium]